MFSLACEYFKYFTPAAFFDLSHLARGSSLDVVLLSSVALSEL